MTFGEWAERYRMNRPGIEALARTGHAMDAEVTPDPSDWPPADPARGGYCEECKKHRWPTWPIYGIGDRRLPNGKAELCGPHFRELILERYRRE